MTQIERVTDDVYVFTSELYAQVTAGVINTRLGAILVDTLPYPAEALEMKQFVESGGMINFTLVEDKVRFEINLGSAKKVNLKINPKLLKLAVSVKQ